MAFDAATGTTILFGGADNTSTFGDTWSWNGTAWTQLSPATSPPARDLASMAYDASLGKIVLFGGFDGTTDLNDTWTWNRTTWASVTTPVGLTARSDAARRMMPDRQQPGALRGESGSGSSYYGDTWLYGSTGWTQAAPSHYPGPRAGEGLAFNPVLGHVVLGGGYDSTLTYDDQWLVGTALTGSRATPRTTPAGSPTPCS